MFGQRRQQPNDSSKIRLPRAASAPVMSDLHYLFAQARENRGREVEVAWFEPMLSKTFSLGCLVRPSEADAIWTIWEESNGVSNLTWQYQTSDFMLIHDVLNMLDKKVSSTPASEGSITTFNNPPPAEDANAGPSATTRPRSDGYVPPFSPAARRDNIRASSTSTPAATHTQSNSVLDGELINTPMPQLLQTLAMGQLTGKLQVIGENAVGDIYFMDGVPCHAATPAEYGDDAIRELVAWEIGSYNFKPDQTTTMRSVQKMLPSIISEGMQLLDQKRLLKKAGLTFESYLVRRHKTLSETELKLMLSKGSPLDWQLQKDIFDYLSQKRTLTDLLRDKPMETSLWTALIFNFLSCGLIDVKQPDGVQGSALDFLGETKNEVQTLAATLIRPESGMLCYEALLYFLQYEYFRYEAYGFPLSLVVFDVLMRKQEASMEVYDRLPSQAASIASMRIDLVKRKLDVLGHFEALDYAIVMPNTKASSAAFVANRIYETLTATPLFPGVDRSTLFLSFGVANLPSDGDDLQSLVHAAKDAKARAKQGAFPVVLARSHK
jgi:hypothetical protein